MISLFYGRLLESELGRRPMLEESSSIDIRSMDHPPERQSFCQLFLPVNGTLQTSQTFLPPVLEISRSAARHFLQSFTKVSAYSIPWLFTSACYYYSITKAELVAKKKNNSTNPPLLWAVEVAASVITQMCLYLLSILHSSPMLDSQAFRSLYFRQLSRQYQWHICLHYTRRPMSTDHTSDVCISFCTCTPNKAQTSNLTTYRKASPKSIPCSQIVSSVGFLLKPPQAKAFVTCVSSCNQRSGSEMPRTLP